MKYITALFVGLLTSFSAFALELDNAKNMGLVGEMPNGYISVVSTTNLEAEALVDEVNAKRKAHYQEIANKQNTPLANIERIAGEKLSQMAQSEG
ncbi:MAG: YdbL family protein, partial [Oleibacter sp.]|nr:YdbL family protein [Thalassolituus sp.]